MSVSIIVPVLNEAPQIQPFLLHLKATAPEAEVIVVDGGSSDATPSLGRGLCDLMMAGRPCRPSQMNLGAQQARGDILWFLHADCEVPIGCIQSIRDALADPQVVGGCFRVRIPKAQWIYRIHDGLAHYVGRVLRVRCGDHGIFVRRSAFHSVGGYPNVPIMEEVDLFRAVHRLGRIAWLPDRLLLSARRHEQVGVYRYTFVCALIVALYCVGAAPGLLARLYARLVPSRQEHKRFRPLPPVEDELFSKFRTAPQTTQPSDIPGHPLLEC